MLRPDFRGARGANAGDDYHELWALRESLALLEPGTPLAAVAVEGVHPEDEKDTTSEVWDGVDCAYYFGGETLATAVEIRIDQVKYSSADPEKPWTVARLTASPPRKKAVRSVLGRLGDAFEQIRERRPDLVEAGRVAIRLVSNQPLAQEVVAALAGLVGTPQTSSSQSTTPAANATGASWLGGASGGAANRRGRQSGRRPASGAAGGLATDGDAANRRLLAKASRVPADHQATFFRAVDFSQCGGGSRLAVEGELTRRIATWTNADARPLLDTLMRAVRRLMMPEGKGQIITRSDVLAWLGFSDEAALFPCPSALIQPSRRVPRAVSRDVVAALSTGRQRVCLHGGGGVGKTTALFEVRRLLPSGSQMVTYDCYGGGRYLDAESPRHRPQEAFLQLANDLAATLRLPLLVTRQATVAAFANRLTLAAEALGAAHPDALLVIAVDAADNAVYAAKRHAPPESPFVHDLAWLGDLPPNVRLLITARTSRLDELGLRRDFTRIELSPFTEAETGANVRSRWASAPGAWIEDFHALSNGNPRVQAYAFGTADPGTTARGAATEGVDGDVPVFGIENRVARALDALRPTGKDLDRVFAEQFEHAIRKSGSEMDAASLAGGLIALPRPIPIAHLAAVVERTPDQIREFCQDLAPGIRLEGDTIGFADEDFEQFVREEAGPIAPLLKRVADRLSVTRSTDAYAALHVAPALFAADRRADVITLAQADDPLEAVRDPVARRDIQLQRLRLAMRVCREAGVRSLNCVAVWSDPRSLDMRGSRF